MSTPMTAVGRRVQPAGISLCPISPGTGQMKLQIMQLRHLSSTSFGLRAALSQSRASPPAPPPLQVEVICVLQLRQRLANKVAGPRYSVRAHVVREAFDHVLHDPVTV